MILLAIVMPPLAVLLCGKPMGAFLNLLLSLCGYFPGAIHAILTVNAKKADDRQKEMIAAMRAMQR